jgi:hypothetical protein
LAAHLPQKPPVVGAGIEPATHGFSVANQARDETNLSNAGDSICDEALIASSELTVAESAAFSASIRPVDPDLAAVVAVWPMLPAAVRTSIVAAVEAAVVLGEK